MSNTLRKFQEHCTSENMACGKCKIILDCCGPTSCIRKSQAAENVCLHFLSILVSVSVVIANKEVLVRLQDPAFGMLLVPLHMFFTMLVAWNRVSEESRIPHAWLLAHAMIVMCSLYASLLVLSLSTVGFQQLGRLGSIPVSALVDRYFWRVGPISPEKLVCILGIVLGVCSVSSDIVEVPPVAVICNLFAVAGQVCSQTCVKLITQKFSVPPREFLSQACPYSLAVVTFTASVPFAYDTVINSRPVEFRMRLLTSPKVLLIISVSCFLGVAVQFLSTKLGQSSSALTYALLTLTKSVCTIAVGTFSFSENFSRTKAAGTILTLTMLFRFLTSGELSAARTNPVQSKMWFNIFILAAWYIIALCSDSIPYNLQLFPLGTTQVFNLGT